MPCILHTRHWEHGTGSRAWAAAAIEGCRLLYNMGAKYKRVLVYKTLHRGPRRPRKWRTRSNVGGVRGDGRNLIAARLQLWPAEALAHVATGMLEYISIHVESVCRRMRFKKGRSMLNTVSGTAAAPPPPPELSSSPCFVAPAMRRESEREIVWP